MSPTLINTDICLTTPTLLVLCAALTVRQTVLMSQREILHGNRFQELGQLRHGRFVALEERITPRPSEISLPRFPAD
jgi:hypothetical protein